MVTTYLKQFVQHVPSCSEGDAIACLRDCFTTGTHQAIVITDESRRPSGNVLLNHWLSYASILASAPKRPSLKRGSLNTPQASNRTDDSRDITWHTPIHDAIGADGFDSSALVLSPVAIAPDYWTLEQFRDHAQLLDYLPHEAVVWVVVDRQGAYLGVLDECAVWRSLALSGPSVVSSPFGTVPEVGDRYWPSTLYQGQSSQPSPLDDRREGIRFAVTTNAAESTDILTRLIETLPLPLMVQTTNGQAVLHNTAWQRHICHFQNLDAIQNQISGLLGGDSAPGHVNPRSTHFPSHPQQFCEMGHGPNECVCSCTLDNGDSRTWKLIKVPLKGISILDRGIAKSYPDLQPAIAPTSSEDTDSSFQRSALGTPSQDIHEVSASAETPTSPTSSAHPPDVDSLWLVIAQDITTHQRVTDSLAAQNENLEQSNRLKDEFLHCITHELKTPLTSMLGLSSLLKDQAIGSLNERQIQYAHLIYKSGRQLVSLVNNILDLTRLETGEFQLNFDVVNIQATCEQAYREALEVQDLSDKPSQSHAARPPQADNTPAVSFTIDIQPGLHHTVADGLRLKQMLMQLLSNALKFSHFQGSIELHVSLWESWLAFTVTDQGVGIPLDKQHLIFQKFQQVEHPLTRTFEGAGLGLVLVQKLAELHGGDISFTSEEGKGSQFTLLLPAAPLDSPGRAGYFSPMYPSYGQPCNQTNPDPASDFQGISPLSTGAIAPSKSHPSSSQHQGLAVVVETSASVLETITHHLNQLGYRVVVARSGTEALGKVRRLQPSVILLSLTVPMLSGLDVLLLLKTDVATQHIPIITLSAASEVRKAKDLGADAQLEYPVGVAELYSRLHHVMKGHHEPRVRTQSMTVLYLNPERASERDEQDGGTLSDSSIPLSTEKLNALVHPLHCRVLEVDDMDQAELLSQVWHPNVILLSNAVTDYASWLAFLNQSEVLGNLPVITLTLAHTEAANRDTHLKVFPCLNFNAWNHTWSNSFSDLKQASSPLLEVLQIASGVYRVPHVVVFTPDYVGSDDLNPGDASHEARLEASMKYLQTAGIRVMSSDSLDQSVDDVNQHAVDLLLVYCPHAHTASDVLGYALQQLRQHHEMLPILLWVDDDQAPAPTRVLNTETAFASLVESLGIQVIYGRLPMNEILTAVNAAIAHP